MKPVISSLFSMLALLLPAVAFAQGNDFSIESLMRVMQETADPTVRYTEEKYSDMLDIALTSSGTLSIGASGVLEKTVDGTSLRKMIVTQTELQIINEQDDQIKIISLERYPVIKAFVAAFTATLQGDLVTLKKYYTVNLSGELLDWTLLFTPANEILEKAVISIQIYGSNGKTLKYIIKEYRGDTSILLIGDEVL